MTKAGLKFIGDAMEAAGIAYDFMEFTSSIERLETYWVGEYSEQEPVSEDGCMEQQFILTGTGKSSWLCLENEKEKICRKNHRYSCGMHCSGCGSIRYKLLSDSAPLYQ